MGLQIRSNKALGEAAKGRTSGQKLVAKGIDEALFDRIFVYRVGPRSH